MKRTALNEVHRRAGARMVDFAGWEMPVRYEGIVAEHTAVRTAAGIFDASHMGEFRIDGPGAAELVDRVTTNDVGRLDDGGVQYSVMTNADGTVVDDLLVYRLRADSFMLVVNAGNTPKDLDWLRTHNRFDARVTDISHRTGLIAIQGPLAAACLERHAGTDLAALPRYRFLETALDDVAGILSRTGYTGEDGFEFYFSAEHAPALWRALLDANRDRGLRPAGLGARNTLRLEAGMLLYGNDMDEGTTAIEAGLDRVVRLDAGDFIGRDSLRAEKAAGPRRKLAGFRMLGADIARDGYAVHLDGEEAGRVTSGSPSITLKTNIGLAYLPLERALPGTPLRIRVRNRSCPAQVVDTPFYKRGRAT